MSISAIGEIVIFNAPDGSVQTEVRLESDTLWLTQHQLEELFDTDRTAVVKHIRNILDTGELEEAATCAKFAQVRQEGSRKVNRAILHYNLDMILSVGYRVNSKRGTQFRIWANRILKEHLVNGYTINQKRLLEQQSRLRELKESISLVERSLLSEAQNIEEARTIIQVLADFAGGLAILDDYDHETLETKGKSPAQAVKIDKDEFLKVVETMRHDFDSEIFGRQKDDSFGSSVSQMYQSFDGKELYPSIEHKAAMLLYLVIKNHSFVDGNKRIAAALFLYFLERNGLLYRAGGDRIIGNDGLATLTLLIAVSKSEEMDTMIKIIVTILNRGNV
ncbi:MAG: virulence protein RhuM/Fic/DOC family protein [Spirochaetes bacterium]|nr:virulence protein RhuM/Fic/DOC family protein [Spirochaetota bacterium]